MRRSDKTRARRAGESDGRAHAQAVYDDAYEELDRYGDDAPDARALEALRRAGDQGAWDVPARAAMAASARLIPRAAHEIYYAGVNRGAERYIKEALNGHL